MSASDYSVLIIWSEEDEAFLAHVPELAGCVADGATREEALGNATVAAQNWIDTAKEIGREIPEPVRLERFERPFDSEAQLRKAVEIELSKIVPELVARLRAEIFHGFTGLEATAVATRLGTTNVLGEYLLAWVKHSPKAADALKEIGFIAKESKSLSPSKSRTRPRTGSLQSRQK